MLRSEKKSTVARNRIARVASVLAVATVCGLGAAPASATDLPPGFDEATLTEGVFIPTAVEWSPPAVDPLDANARDGLMFVAEKQGRVFAAPAGEEMPRQPLIDLTQKVNDRGERGMLDLAVDKDFASNGYLYLLYTVEVDPLAAPDSEDPVASRLTRVTIQPDGTVDQQINPTEEVILGKESTDNPNGCPAPANDLDCIPADHVWHAIGTVISDPSDGSLWVGNGDGHEPASGIADETAFRTLDEESFSGKVIHIDRDGNGLPGHQFCETEADLTKTCTKIHAAGFRNPYRFTLGPDGNPIVGDVGWGGYEEVNFAQPGETYGWPCYEGPNRQPTYESAPRCQELYALEDAGDPKAANDPDWSYPHPVGGGASVQIGPLYPGGGYPDTFDGKVFVADYVQGWVKLITLNPDGSFAGVEQIQEFASGWPPGVDLELMPGGDLAYVDIGFGAEGPPKGAVRRFTYEAGNLQPIPVAESDVTEGPPSLTVAFDGSDSYDPDDPDVPDAPLSYKWDFGDGSPRSTAASPTHTYSARGTYTARLTVDDGTERFPTDRIEIRVGTPPVASIDTAPLTYRGGEALTFTGSATDADEPPGTEPLLSWTVIRVHGGDHNHFVVPNSPGEQLSFTDDRGHDADSYYEVILTATDSNGQTSVDEVRIDPETIRLTLASSPEGAPLNYGDGPWKPGAPPDGPANDAAIGFRTPVSAATSFVNTGTTYVFDRWSNGGEREQSFDVPAVDTALTAYYVPLDTAIDSGPAEGATIEDATPTFAFSSAAGSAFECRFGNAPFSSCVSPHTPSSALAQGQHTFVVRATDGPGAVDLQPATRTFTVTPPTPPTPSDFAFGKLELSKRKGTARLPVVLPGPGQVRLSGEGVRATGLSVSRGGVTKLRVIAKGRAADLLKKRGRVTVEGTVTFTPSGGTAASKAKRLKLIRRTPAAR